MFEEEIVLCASSAYEKKFYINPQFSSLPEDIRDELKAMCVLFTEDVGGTLELVFIDDGELLFRVDSNENDLLYDEIGSALKIKQLKTDKSKLLEALSMFYKIVFLGEEA